jgi:pimeloyl-ACP methyl ester carboxylesterase
MVGKWRAWLQSLSPNAYARRQPLILVNGLAEQAESWFRNHRFWRKHFDVHMPNMLAYEGEALHHRIEEGLPISVDYLVEQLHFYLENFVQAPPYHLVGASLGGKVVIEYAIRYPQNVSRLVLLCPSGMGDEERLPIIDGVRRSDIRSLVESVFHDVRQMDLNMVDYYRKQFVNRRWRTGLLKTIRGTMDHCVRDRLSQVIQPTLFVTGAEDRVVDRVAAESAARLLPQGQFLSIPHCGHAPQMEKPWLINRLVVHFLTSARPTPHPRFHELLLVRANTIL